MSKYCPVCKKEYGILDSLMTPIMCGECYKAGRSLPKAIEKLPSNSPSIIVEDDPNSITDRARVKVVDIDMPFGSMVVFMVKWSLASIPAFIILTIFFSVLFGILEAMFSGIITRL
jgi:hypothetical protein